MSSECLADTVKFPDLDLTFEIEIRQASKYDAHRLLGEYVGQTLTKRFKKSDSSTPLDVSDLAVEREWIKKNPIDMPFTTLSQADFHDLAALVKEHFPIVGYRTDGRIERLYQFRITTITKLYRVGSFYFYYQLDVTPNLITELTELEFGSLSFMSILEEHPDLVIEVFGFKAPA